MGKTTPPAEAPAVPGWGNWHYIGPAGRIYTNIPVTVSPGDIVTWPEIPAPDGAWFPTDDPPNRHPDNWQPEPEPPIDAAPPADES